MAQQSTALVTVDTLRDGGIYTLTTSGQREYVTYVTNTINDESAGFLYTLANFVSQDGVSYYVMAGGAIYSETSGLPNCVSHVETSLTETDLPSSCTDSAEDMADRVMNRLVITADALNSLYVTSPVNGFVGTMVADEIRRRFGLDAVEPLGAQLAERGVLTYEEAEYLDDAE